MNYYEDVYKKRLNRYGFDYQSRIQGQRERVFEDLLLKSIYRVNFLFNGELIPGLLERRKQDETETLQYLLTRVKDNIPNGTILMISNKDGIECPWMIYYLESIQASGYNRYIVLKMTHTVEWTGRDKNTYSSWCYFYGQEDNMLKDELKSRSRSDVLYNENLKLYFMVMPTNENIKKDDYFVMSDDNMQQGFVVTGFDYFSTPGVEYVSVDPVYLHDTTPPPQPQPGESSEDYFWLEGDINGST